MEAQVWYVATRKDSGGHHLFHGPDYLEAYEREFERIREFDDLDEAKKALAARESVEYQRKIEAQKEKVRKNIRASKVRGDIRKGSVEDEELRARIKAELMAEMAVEEETAKATKSNTGPKTRARSNK